MPEHPLNILNIYKPKKIIKMSKQLIITLKQIWPLGIFEGEVSFVQGKLAFKFCLLQYLGKKG